MSFSNTVSRWVTSGLLCVVFLLALVSYSSVDLAFAFACSLYFLSRNKNPLILLLSSAFLFIFNMYYLKSELHVGFITDLDISAYILFLTAVCIYLKNNRDFSKKISKLLKSENTIVTKGGLIKITSITVISLLLFPIFGGYLSALFGYSVYLYTTKNYHGRIAPIIALLLLGITAILTAFNNIKMAVDFTNYTYMFIFITVIGEITDQKFIAGAIKKIVTIIHETIF